MAIQTQVWMKNNELALAETVASEAASEASEVQHEVTLYPEPIAHFGSFVVTNSLLNSWLAVVVIIVLSWAVGRKVSRVPSRMQALVETVVEGAMKLADSVTGARSKTLKVFPFIFALFLFVLVNNWLGLIPGVGSIGFIEMIEGHKVFVPLFRGATADFNTTLALAIMSVVGSNIFGVIVVGAWKYFNKFVQVKELVAIPGEIIKNPTIIFVNPIKFFVGLIEIVGEIAKTASLSFRLFGNIFAGEVLLTSIAVIFAFGLPIPFMFLEVIVGIIQALIFAMLTLVYFTVAATAEEH